MNWAKYVKLADGTELEPGDLLQIDQNHRGLVVLSMDTGRFLPGYEDWAYLQTGIMVDTDFGGLVHYTAATDEDFVLLRRGATSKAT